MRNGQEGDGKFKVSLGRTQYFKMRAKVYFVEGKATARYRRIGPATL